jgi:ribosomal protein S18 acetylase RimI-like enzyme
MTGGRRGARVSAAIEPELALRRSTPDDAEGVHRALDAVARERRYLGFLEAPSVENVRAFLSSPGLLQWVALAGAEIVGWCDVRRSALEGFRHVGVLGMGLLPAYRGRGLGRALLLATLRSAREAGLARMELEVLASNRAAIALYEREGFEHEGRKRAGRVLDGEAEDVLCMALLFEAAGAPPSS